MPNNPRAGGISRRAENKDRSNLRDLIRGLNLPEDMGLIIRTAGVGKTLAELKWDMDSLLQQWHAIEAVTKEQRPVPYLIYQEGDTIMRAIRDYLRQDIQEILVDSLELFEKTKQYIAQVKPDFTNRIKLYQNKIPLFSFYQIERQIETAYQRIVHLPSGGAIVIDHSEALVSIDVNSAKATSGSDIEETAFNTNLEAAEEIARQLRLRDIGGLIVIDFIDMSYNKNQREVSQFLRKSLECDRARVQVGNITRFGLLEMSRQQLRSTLGEAIQVPCPRCDGQGTIRSIKSLASSILLMLEGEAAHSNVAEIQVQLPVDLATFMLNEKRDVLTEMVKRQQVRIIVLPNHYLETPQYKIKRMRKTNSNSLSYTLLETHDTTMPEQQELANRTAEKPAIKSLLERPKNKGSFWAKIKGLMQGVFQTKTVTKKNKNKVVRKTSSKFKRKNTTRKDVPKKRRRPERKNYKNTSRHNKSKTTPTNSHSETTATPIA